MTDYSQLVKTLRIRGGGYLNLASANAIEALQARVAELEAGLRFITAPDASYHGPVIRLEIPCESHGDAIRKLDNVRALLDSKDMAEHRKLYDRWQEHALGIPAADTGQAVAGKSRNQIINCCSYDLAQLVQSHSPDQTSLNNLVWGRLQTMACEIEATHPAPLDAERVLNDLLDNAPTDTIRKYLRSQGAVPLQKRVERAALRQKENNNAE